MKPTRRQIDIMAKCITPEMYRAGLRTAVVLPYLSAEVCYIVQCQSPYTRNIYTHTMTFIESVELDPETNYETR